MQAFANAGIYVWLDLATVWQSIHRVEPQRTREIYDTWTTTVDNFAEYDNVLFLTISNEVLDADCKQALVYIATRPLNDTDILVAKDAAPYIKAAVRDIKAFRNARGYRPLPIIYTSTDDEDIRALTGEFLACGDEDDAIDAFGINVYSWCGESSFYEAGYDTIYEEFQDLNIPVLFSETGCNPDKGDRKFPDVQAMLGSVLQAVFSGVVVYEWAMHENDYGIVEYPSAEGKGFPSTLAEYNSLASVFSSMKPSGTSRTSYTPSNSAPECPESEFGFATRSDLPTIRGLAEETITQRTSWSDPLATETTEETESGPTSTGARETSGAGQSGEGQGGGNGEPEEDNETPASDDGGLSGGAIGGIAAGVSVLVVAVVAAAAFFFLRKRKARKAALASEILNVGAEKKGPPVTTYEVGSNVPELGGGARYMSQELDGAHGQYGMGTQVNPAELAQTVYELPAGRG